MLVVKLCAMAGKVKEFLVRVNLSAEEIARTIAAWRIIIKALRRAASEDVEFLVELNIVAIILTALGLVSSFWGDVVVIVKVFIATLNEVVELLIKVDLLAIEETTTESAFARNMLETLVIKQASLVLNYAEELVKRMNLLAIISSTGCLRLKAVLHWQLGDKRPSLLSFTVVRFD